LCFCFVFATIVAFEVIMSHNSRPDCACQSVKTSSGSEDSNAYLEVYCACLWCIWGATVYYVSQYKFCGFI